VRVTLYYDDQCVLCRNLAFLVARTDSQIAIAPLGEVDGRISAVDEGLGGSQSRASIVVDTSDGFLVGRSAWEFLLAHYQGLKYLHWIAVKLHISEETAGAVQSIAHQIKKWCRNCSARSFSTPRRD
jgi:predicted DCC family thiol-disulfide oxidoreductase YuxK